MQKIFLTALFSIAVIQGSLFAQQNKIPVPHDMALLHGGSGSGYLNEINIRAMRDFAQKFKEVPDAEWYKIKNGYTVLFRVEGIMHRCFYSDKGNWVYTIKYYTETGLPFEVRDIVKRAYYDYAITTVEEIAQPDNPVVYLVHIADQTKWKIVSVCEGEMKVMQDYFKG